MQSVFVLLVDLHLEEAVLLTVDNVVIRKYLLIQQLVRKNQHMILTHNNFMFPNIPHQKLASFTSKFLN